MIFNMVGGGAGGAGGGATLVVSSPANVSVTVSKDDKSYTKNSGSLGSATFKGLATGTWTVVISNDGQTATKTIEITADYAITLAFFSATINITYPANSTCVVINSGGQTVASDTNATSSEKTWTATVGATGTYTVTATTTDGSEKSKSQNVGITADGQSVDVALIYQLVLFDGSAGGDVTSVTGGWSNSGGTKVLNSTQVGLKVKASGESNKTYTAILYTNQKISLAEYKSLIFNFTSVSSHCSIYVSADNNSVTASKGTASGLQTLDVSSLNGEYYIGLRYSFTLYGTFDLTNIANLIYLE